MFINYQCDNKSKEQLKKGRGKNEEKGVHHRMYCNPVIEKVFVVFKPDKWLSEMRETENVSVQA
jgi:hypothetical protein